MQLGQTSHILCAVLFQVTSVVLDSLRSYGLWATSFLSPWDSLGNNTGVGCHALLQGIFPTGIEPLSPALAANSLAVSHLGTLLQVDIFENLLCDSYYWFM